MFEFDKYDPRKPGIRSRPSGPYQPFAGGRKRALLLWGEHCIECAVPDCFTTCDLYEARADERCRRFQYGIYRNPNFPSARGFGAEVVFKRWGKIEARGNATMLSSPVCAALERGLGVAAPVLNAIGRGTRWLGAGIRWSYLAFGAFERLNGWVRRRRDPRARPDAFVAEIYNPGAAPIALVFFVAVDRGQMTRKLSADQLPPAYSRRLTVEPGYNRFDVPVSEFLPILDSDLPFNMALIPDAEDGSHLVFLSLDLIAFDGQSAAPETAVAAGDPAGKPLPAAKCVVFDLDNTLWDGVLLEGDVTLRPGVAEIFKELDARGVLISIVSKNSHDEAMEKLKVFGLDAYLLFPQINWTPKSRNIAAIADAISINLDTFLFVDDNPFEREEVARAHPRVETIPETGLAALLYHPRLQGSKTAEASQRRAMYQEAIKRSEAAVAYGDDYLAFLKSCAIVVEIMPIREEHAERVIELVQRTNQLNFSGRKYGREEITRIVEEGTYDQHVIACSDMFGSYGVVGLALTRPIENGVRVEDFMLSCRVQGKFIEQALFDYLVRQSDPPARMLEISFARTDRNGPAVAVLKKLGFPVDETEAGVPLRLAVGPGDLAVDFLTIKAATPADPTATGSEPAASAAVVTARAVDA